MTTIHHVTTLAAGGAAWPPFGVLVGVAALALRCFWDRHPPTVRPPAAPHHRRHPVEIEAQAWEELDGVLPRTTVRRLDRPAITVQAHRELQGR